MVVCVRCRQSSNAFGTRNGCESIAPPSATSDESACWISRSGGRSPRELVIGLARQAIPKAAASATGAVLIRAKRPHGERAAARDPGRARAQRWIETLFGGASGTIETEIRAVPVRMSPINPKPERSTRSARTPATATDRHLAPSPRERRAHAVRASAARL